MPEVAIELETAATPNALFDFQPKELWLEIGFGGGEHIAWQAAANPEIGLIGAEPFVNGVASLLGHIDREKISNIRVWADDVRPLLDALPDAIFTRVFILHPDPWPKRRHANRRIVSQPALDSLARLMTDNGLLRVASDVPSYVDWTLFQLGQRQDFAWTARCPADWRNPPADWPATRYETKTSSEGRPPTYLQFRRYPRD